MGCINWWSHALTVLTVRVLPVGSHIITCLASPPQSMAQRHRWIETVGLGQGTTDKRDMPCQPLLFCVTLMADVEKCIIGSRPDADADWLLAGSGRRRPLSTGYQSLVRSWIKRHFALLCAAAQAHYPSQFTLFMNTFRIYTNDKHVKIQFCIWKLCFAVTVTVCK